MNRLSSRLAALVDALPLVPGMRVLEIGGGPGAAARAVARRLVAGAGPVSETSEGSVSGPSEGPGRDRGELLMIDRSAKSIALASRNAAEEISAGWMRVRQVGVEDFVLETREHPFDLAFAFRVGAFDGRHPEIAEQALDRVSAALRPGGRYFIDGGDPLREIDLQSRT